jgi:hypothetical protein
MKTSNPRAAKLGTVDAKALCDAIDPAPRRTIRL